jgi:hypothetical protein
MDNVLYRASSLPLKINQLTVMADYDKKPANISF